MHTLRSILLLTLAALALGCASKPAGQPKAEAAPADVKGQKIDALKQVVTGDGLPAGHPPVDMSGASMPGMSGAKPAPEPVAGPFTVADLRITPPAAWRPVRPSSSMRAAEFAIPGSAGDAEAVAYYFGPGQGGGVEDNVARWIAQFVPEPGSSSVTPRESLEVAGIRVTVVRARGAYHAGVGMGQPSEPRPGYALVGLILESPKGPVFLKITGPAATIDAASDAIDELIHSVAVAA